MPPGVGGEPAAEEARQGPGREDEEVCARGPTRDEISYVFS